MNGSSIFKKVGPVLLVIVLIIAISLVATSAKASTNTPQISDPDAEYVSIKETLNGKEYKYILTKQEMYEELKAGIGLSTVITETNKKVLAEQMKSISAEDIEKEINDATYGEDVDPDSLTQEEKEEMEKDFADSMFQNYGYETTSEIEEHYRLVLAKEAYAREKLEAEAKEADEDSDLYIDDEDIDEYYEENYSKSYYAFIVPFASEKQVSMALLQLGVVNNNSKWVHATLKEVKVGSGIYEIEKGEELTVPEIIETVFNLYEMVYGYKNEQFTVGTATFDSEKKVYTVSEGCDYAIVSCEEDLQGFASLIEEIKVLVTPEKGLSDGTDEEENLILTDEAKTKALAKLEEVQTLLDVISNKVIFASEVSKVQTIIDSLKASLEYDATTDEDEDTTPEDPTIIIDQLANAINNFDAEAYIFNTDNEESKFYQSYEALKEFDSNLPSKFKSNYVDYVPYAVGDTEASANGGKWFSASSVSSGNMYYIVIKIKEVAAPQLSDVKEEIKAKLLEEKLTESYINEKIAELRQENNFVIYDTKLEEEYISNVSSYENVKYKKVKKANDNIVAKSDVLTITADDLFKAMDKTSGVATAISELSYRRLINNSAFNTYYNSETGEWIGEEGKEKRDEIKESVENQRLYYLAGYYSSYGYDPSSVSWEEFLRSVNGANDEADLAFLTLYSEIVSDYIEKALKTITVEVDGKDTKFGDTYTEALTSKVWKLIEEKMAAVQAEEFTVTGVHLLVSVYETVNDAVSAKNDDESTVSALAPEDWTAEQVALAKELIAEITKYLEYAEGTYEDKLEAIVSAYENAPYAYKVNGEYVTIIDDYNELYKYTLDCGEFSIDLAKYKSAGLTLTYQNLGSFSNGTMVDAFNNAAKEIWEKDFADKEFNRITVYDKAIETEFGYHLYVNLSSSNYTEYESIEVDSQGNPTYTNDVVNTFTSTLPSLYEIRLSLLLSALEGIDQTELSEEDAKAVQDMIDELSALYTTEIETIVEKYATPIIENFQSTYYSSLVQQSEILELLQNATINSPSGINYEKIKKALDLNIESIFESYLTNLDEGAQEIVKASEVYGK